MRYASFLTLSLIALGALAGCQETPGAKKANDKASKEIKEAENATADALKVQREEYKKKMDADLEKLDSKLDTWKEKAKDAKGDAKVALEKQIDTLEVQRDKVREQLKDLKGDTKDAWAEVKKGLDKAMGELSDAFDKAKDSFK